MIQLLKIKLRPLVVWFRFFLYRYCRHLIRVYLRWFWKPKDEVTAMIGQLSEDTKGLKFLQIGTNDGLTNDPIIKLMIRDGWTGIRVEPLNAPLRFLNFLHSGNDGVTPIQCLIGTKQGDATIYQISFSDHRWATGLASMDRSNLEHHVSNGYVEKKAKKFGDVLPAKKQDWIEGKTLEVREINEFILSSFPDGLDHIQIDVEGYDAELILALDLNRIKPRSICFERIHLSKEQADSCGLKLREHGYRLMESDMDTLAYVE